MRKVHVHDGGGTVDETVYLGSWERYRRTVSSNLTERETLHVSDDVRRIAMVETLTWDAGTEVTTPDPRLRLQLDNHLGSSFLELDEDAGIISYEEYHPYGTTAYHAADSTVEISAKRYRYTGKERDEETGLNYHGARYYAPWLGRWTAADPAGMVDGPSLYPYANNNPLIFNDPTGREGLLGHDPLPRYSFEATGPLSSRIIAESGGAEAPAPPGPLTAEIAREDTASRIEIGIGETYAKVDKSSEAARTLPPEVLAAPDRSTPFVLRSSIAETVPTPYYFGTTPVEDLAATLYSWRFSGTWWKRELAFFTPAVGIPALAVGALRGILNIPFTAYVFAVESELAFRAPNWEIALEHSGRAAGAGGLTILNSLAGAGVAVGIGRRLAIGSASLSGFETAGGGGGSGGPGGAGLMTVSRWGKPGLDTGAWVMKGPVSWRNYIFSFKWEPRWLGGNMPAAYSTGATYTVSRLSVRWPPGWGIEGWWRGMFGQRIYMGPPVPPPAALPGLPPG